MTSSNTLIVFAKAPRLGLVKTRLGRDIGHVEALRVYRVVLGAVLRRLGHDPRWRLAVAVTPDAAAGPFTSQFGIECIGQGQGDLGQRMQRVFDTQPPGPAIIIGSDIPRIAPDHIARGFAALGAYDAAIGPASDGGYWLIGAKRSPRVPRFFDNVRWSTPHARADTLRNLRGQSVAMLDELEDVDDEASYLRWRRAGEARRKPACHRDGPSG